MHSRVERNQRNGHVGRMGRDALLTRAQDCELTGEACARGAARTRIALVAFRVAYVGKVMAARALQQIAAGSRHVAQLR